MFDLSGKDKAFVDRLMEGVSLIEQGILFRLYKRYLSEYGDDMAWNLAGIFSCRIFLSQLSKNHQKFFEVNEELMEKEFIDLSFDQETRYAVTQGTAAMYGCYYINSNKFFNSTNKNDLNNIMLHMNVLKDKGLLIPDAKNLSPEEFIIFAKDFYNASKNG